MEDVVGVIVMSGLKQEDDRVVIVNGIREYLRKVGYSDSHLVMMYIERFCRTECPCQERLMRIDQRRACRSCPGSVVRPYIPHPRWPASTSSTAVPTCIRGFHATRSCTIGVHSGAIRARMSLFAM